MHRPAAAAPFWFMLFAYGVACAADYPNRPVRLIVATAPGGGQSAVARAVTRQLETQIGPPFIVDNRGGANGIIGYDLVAKAVPDGYTLLHTSVAFVINASVYKSLPFSVERDFTPVTNVCAGFGALLVTHPSLPVQTVKEFIAHARAHQLSYSSPGLGNVLHLIAESFNVQAGTGMLHVPYKGAGPALLAVMGNEVQVTVSSPPTAVPQVKAGKVKALGYSGVARLEALPDVPTIAEAGLPGFTLDSGWHGWFAPAHTPAAIVNRLHAEIAKALQAPALREFLLANGYQPQGDPPPEFRRIFAADIKRWGEVARVARIEPQ